MNWLYGRMRTKDFFHGARKITWHRFHGLFLFNRWTIVEDLSIFLRVNVDKQPFVYSCSYLWTVSNFITLHFFGKSGVVSSFRSG